MIFSRFCNNHYIMYCRNEIKKMNIYKSEIFETKKKIEELVVYVPAQRRLIDVEDLDIIES